MSGQTQAGVGGGSEGARRAGRAQLAYGRGLGGYYVINAFTKIPVAGPFDMPSKAEMEALRLEPPSMRVIHVAELPNTERS